MDEERYSDFIDERNRGCCAGAFPQGTRSTAESEERVLILGADGWRRRRLERVVAKALGDLNETEPIGIRDDPVWLERYYVLGAPALVIGGTVVSVGCVLSRREARIYLERYL